MFGEISGMYMVSGVVVLVTLIFDYVPVRLRGCGNDDARDMSYCWVVVQAVVVVGPWAHAFHHNVPFVTAYSLSGNSRHLLFPWEWKAD